jgi:hypothetical protein
METKLDGTKHELERAQKQVHWMFHSVILTLLEVQESSQALQLQQQEVKKLEAAQTEFQRRLKNKEQELDIIDKQRREFMDEVCIYLMHTI